MSEPMDMRSRIDDYLDGTLRGEHRDAFERAMAGDAGLHQEVELARRIDARLRAVFSPPSAIGSTVGSDDLVVGKADHVAGRIGREAPAAASGSDGKGARRSKPLVWIAAAAAVLAAGWYFSPIGPGGARGGDGAMPYYTADRLYDSMKRAKFTPRWVCENEQQFRETTVKYVGREVLFHDKPGVTLVGWTYGGSQLSGWTAYLIAKVEGSDVVVLMEKTENDAPVTAPKESGLHIFKRELPGVVMYEITPRDAAGVVGLAYEPGK